MRLYVFSLALIFTATAHSQQRYTSSEYGISMIVPSGYKLKVGALAPNDPGLGYMGPIPTGFDGPGGTLIATAEAADNLYPGTDFAAAFFAVSLSKFETRAHCTQLKASAEDPEAKTDVGPLLPFIDGRRAFGRYEGGVALGHQYAGATYHVYANQVCYAVQYGLETAGRGMKDGIKNINRRVLLQQLRRNLLTVTLTQSVLPRVPSTRYKGR